MPESSRRSRPLALIIKGQLEAAEASITAFEDEFLAHIVVLNGQTAGEYLKPQTEVAHYTGTMPPLWPHTE